MRTTLVLIIIALLYYISNIPTQTITTVSSSEQRVVEHNLPKRNLGIIQAEEVEQTETNPTATPKPDDKNSPEDESDSSDKSSGKKDEIVKETPQECKEFLTEKDSEEFSRELTSLSDEEYQEEIKPMVNSCGDECKEIGYSSGILHYNDCYCFKGSYYGKREAIVISNAERCSEFLTE